MRHDSPEEIGARLAHIRAGESQDSHAADLGVPLRTYQTYEQGKREPDLRTLLGVVRKGWNANWLLTGEGPERLEAVAVAENPAGYGSQLVSEEHLTLALSQVIEVLQDKELPMPPAKQAELVMAVAELHAEGIPEAKILRFVRAAIAA